VETPWLCVRLTKRVGPFRQPEGITHRYILREGFTVATSFPSPAVHAAPTPRSAENRASEFARHIFNKIQAYDATLDEAHEVGLRLVSAGPPLTFHFEGMGYADPSLISFTGATDAGELIEVIQHVSQINMLLTTVPRLHPEKPKGEFRIERIEDEDE
jgi:Family of unknown function (DUF6173)